MQRQEERRVHRIHANHPSYPQFVHEVLHNDEGKEYASEWDERGDWFAGNFGVQFRSHSVTNQRSHGDSIGISD